MLALKYLKGYNVPMDKHEQFLREPLDGDRDKENVDGPDGEIKSSHEEDFDNTEDVADLQKEGEEIRAAELEAVSKELEEAFGEKKDESPVGKGDNAEEDLLEKAIELKKARLDVEAAMQYEWSVREKIGDIFEAHQNGTERVQDALSKFEPFLKSELLGGESIRAQIEAISAIEDKKEFVEKFVIALKPFFDLWVDNPREFERIERQRFVEKGGYTKVNEILSYGAEGDDVHIHLAPAKALGMEVRRQAIEGLKELAQIVQKDKSIKSISATSWIVAEHPKLMEKFGFTIIEEEGFTSEGKKIAAATMPREEFLERYLEK